MIVSSVWFCLLAWGARVAVAHATNSSLPCRFPTTGEFYIDDGPQRIVRVEESFFETKGHCLRADRRRDFFVVKQKSESETCYRCILFLAFHANVIRFKQSDCMLEDTDLDSLCRRIAGDSPLFTMFRTNAIPIACPIPLPATFAYSLPGSGFCRNDGLSVIDECSVPNRFRVSFSSCPQATKSVTHDEAYECIADWNHYSTYYLAARIVGNPFNPALGDYRCFIVDQATSRIGMSADSSCLELTSLDRASAILNYSNAERSRPTCSFPARVTSFHDWISVTSGNTVKVSKGRWTEVAPSGEAVVKSLCTLEHGNYRVVRSTSGCNEGFFCIKYEQHAYDVFSSTSVPMAVADIDLCMKLQANSNTHFSFDMFIKGDRTESCPFEGLLFSEKCNRPLLSVGCDTPSMMNLTDICSVRFPDDPTDIAITESLVCRANYKTNNETFLIASSRRRFLCMKFWLKNHDQLVVDTYSDTACFAQALSLSKRLPERFEIVQTAGCPTRTVSFVRYFFKPSTAACLYSPESFIFFCVLSCFQRLLQT